VSLDSGAWLVRWTSVNYDDVLAQLFRLGQSLGFDPRAEDCETYLRELLSSYESAPEDAEALLSELLGTRFACLQDVRPQWIQEPEWPFLNGKPLRFVGQIDLHRETRANWGLEQIGQSLRSEWASDRTYFVFSDGSQHKVIVQYG